MSGGFEGVLVKGCRVSGVGCEAIALHTANDGRLERGNRWQDETQCWRGR